MEVECLRKSRDLKGTSTGEEQNEMTEESQRARVAGGDADGDSKRFGGGAENDLKDEKDEERNSVKIGS